MEKDLIFTIAQLERKIYEVKKDVYIDGANLSHDKFINLWEEIKKELEFRRACDKITKIQVFKGKFTLPGSTQIHYGLMIQPSTLKENYLVLDYHHKMTQEKHLVPSQFTLTNAIAFPEVILMCLLAAKNTIIYMADYPGSDHEKLYGQSCITAYSMAESVLIVEANYRIISVA